MLFNEGKNTSICCDTFLAPNGVYYRGEFAYENQNWVSFNIGPRAESVGQNGYVVPTFPVEFHCHGIGSFDFSDIKSLDLMSIEAQLAGEGAMAVLCLYIQYDDFQSFLNLCDYFNRERLKGNLQHIIGLALEGPLFSSFGGTPKIGVWAPTKTEWLQLAKCGALGLKYIVVSPDATAEDATLSKKFTSDHPSIEWIAQCLISHGVRPALGHFQKTNPENSARKVREILETADKCGCTRFKGSIVTDHLYNDMPVKVRYAWRRPEDRANREEDIKKLNLKEWSLDNLNEFIGEVPSSIIKAAKEGKVTACLNFDGEHVDLEIAKRTVEIVGSKNLIAMTDRIDSRILGGQKLEQYDGGTLVYQEEGVVAAGTQPIDRQINNMRKLGLSEREIWDMVSFVPSAVLGVLPTWNDGMPPKRCSYISSSGHRIPIHSDSSLLPFSNVNNPELKAAAHSKNC